MKKYQKIEDTGKSPMNYYWLDQNWFVGLNPSIGGTRLNFVMKRLDMEWVSILAKLFKTIK